MQAENSSSSNILVDIIQREKKEGDQIIKQQVKVTKIRYYVRKCVLDR